MRFRLTIEYDGTPFCGWQSQSPDQNGVAVQDVLADAIEKFCGERVTLFAAGRTDAGVHARGQVVHFDLEKPQNPFKVQEAVNYHLKPNPIAVLEAAEADADFDARFSAARRHYHYRLLGRRPPPTLDREFVWWSRHSLDLAPMQAAAQCLVGKHDFTTFRSSKCQAKSPLKTLDALDVSQDGNEFLVVASARSFLHTQVRSMVGALKKVGEGKWTHDDVAASLAARDRTACAAVAPAAGLTFMQVDYPDPK